MQVAGVGQIAAVVAGGETVLGMRSRIVVTTHRATQVAITVHGLRTITITAIGMIVVKTVDVMPVVMHHPAVVRIPPCRIVAPIPG